MRPLKLSFPRLARPIPLLFCLLLAACGDDPDAPPPPETPDGEPEVRQLTLMTPPVEGTSPPPFGGPAPPTLPQLLTRLRAIERDEDAKAVFLRVGPFGGGWGRVSEVRLALANIRSAGKPIHCHFDTADNVSYLLMATACDRISMTPAGNLELVGVSAHLFFAKRMLTQIGVEAELLHVGRFKGAADPFIEEEIPAATEESMGALLDDLQRSLVEGIAEGRNLSPDAVQRLIDEGPYTSGHDAVEAGLVDDSAFEDEAREHARRAVSVERVRPVPIAGVQEPVGLGEILAVLAGEPPAPPPEGDRLGLVYIEGTIEDGENGAGTGGRSGPFVRAMRHFRDDDGVKAVVVRINSPGGSALASDRMWHALHLVSEKKPVVISVGDMAASGGYYIASAGREIFAHHDSLVGSIGVVAGKFNVSELAETVGVNIHVMTRGENADWTTPSRSFTDEERAILRGMMQETYSRFISRIVLGRNMERSTVAAAAEGRIFTGRSAMDAGLIDRFGGLTDAMARARELGGLGEYSPVERWPQPKGVLDALAETVGGTPEARRRAFLTELAAEAGPIGEAAIQFPLLLDRERTIVALPYVLQVQ